ncbi:uncharacterized protein BDZ99DRAFT_527358 [Mytilinidion resinicola]|uniref:Uncharacterized protein n=1 Tax=Mytilinidion resinicola TaxID=574789 RepID=A0A6A6Y340_9PEZI|nr:uncharacterized protein BDZ99DRAFT_527358 [Mytilinidion resinicola]KAF2802635.1 hypothetical protein BDZ99DRAFT_527358 [Mytilinidion resinicola]
MELSRTALVIAFAHANDHNASPTEFVLSKLEPSKTATASSAPSCPPADRMPQCVNCGGENPPGMCIGHPQKSKPPIWSGCTCIPSQNFVGFILSNKISFVDPKGLPRLLSFIDANGTAKCDGKQFDVETEMWTILMYQFCNQTRSIEDHKVAWAASDDKSANGKWTNYKNWFFTFEWTAPSKDYGTLAPTCSQTFLHMLDDKTSKG